MEINIQQNNMRLVNEGPITPLGAIIGDGHVVACIPEDRGHCCGILDMAFHDEYTVSVLHCNLLVADLIAVTGNVTLVHMGARTPILPGMIGEYGSE
jgi:hypothetical protein